jgi:hypothetical protein
LNELDEKPIIQNFQNLEILKERIHFAIHLIKKECSMGSKCLTLDVGCI